MKREESNLDNDSGYKQEISETIFEQLNKRARPERRSNRVRNGVTLDLVIMLHHPLLQSQYLDHLRQFNQFPSKKKNQYHSSSTIETSDMQSVQENYQIVTEIPSRFYGQVTYIEELQAYVFVDTNARVLAEGYMFVIFDGPTKRYFRYNLTVDQFNLTNAKDHNWTTQYLICKDNIAHQVTEETNYVKQPKAELKQNCD